MRAPDFLFVLVGALTIVPGPLVGSARADVVDRYRAARLFDDESVARLVTDMPTDVAWQGNGAAVLFYRTDAKGARVLMLRAVNGGRDVRVAGSVELVEALANAKATGLSAASELPLSQITVAPDHRSLVFQGDRGRWRVTFGGKRAIVQPIVVFPQPVRFSPDGHRVAFVRHADLFVIDIASGNETRLTRDGTKEAGYALEPSTAQSATDALIDPSYIDPPRLAWSPDSKYILTYKLYERGLSRLSAIQHAPQGGGRPVSITYAYPYPGEAVATADYLIFAATGGPPVKIKTDLPINVMTYSPFYDDFLWWSSDSRRAFFLTSTRGYKQLNLWSADIKTGVAMRQVVENESATYVTRPTWRPTAPDGDPRKIIDLPQSGKILWFSERSGWGHLYLYDYDADVAPIAVTWGPWVVRKVRFVDEAAKRIYFTASGREVGRDPYLEHLYSVSFDGSGLTLLTPEDANHIINFAPDGKSFVDTMSRPDLPAKVVLKRADGTSISELYHTSVDRLAKLGWRVPQTFEVNAADGKTKVYGIIVKPATVNPGESYPVVEAIYPGPQKLMVQKSFGDYEVWRMQALAELGFIVVAVDGTGGPFRSKAFHDLSYGPAYADRGMADHIAAIRQLAVRHPEMDLSRVGIYGESSGGEAVITAMLRFGEFYKVGVAADSVVDPSSYQPHWSERYLGMPETAKQAYRRADRYQDARRLNGSLLIAVGELDSNVHPAQSIKLVQALIDADRDVDFMIVPNGGHGSADSPLYRRKLWNFFVEKLRGERAPLHFPMTSDPASHATAN